MVWNKETLPSHLPFNFALEYIIWEGNENQEEFEWNGTHQFLVFADDINVLGENTNAINTSSVRD
jgi:hypothetical protein